VKLSDIYEMTLNIHHPQTDERVKSYFDFLDKEGVLVGEQDGLDIICVKDTAINVVIYGIKQNNIITSIAVFTPQSDDLWIQKIIHTLTTYRDKQYIFKLLWFIKSQEGKKLLSYGTHTSDGIKFVQSLAKTNRFDLYWYNTKTGDKIPYQYEIDGPLNTPYRSNVMMTDWRVLIEKDEHPSFPRFNTDIVRWLHCVFDD
jgi:hypothetical protein